MPATLNRFQKWADDYARAFGFVVVPRGNWVDLRRGEDTWECMTAAEVQRICEVEMGKGPLDRTARP